MHSFIYLIILCIYLFITATTLYGSGDFKRRHTTFIYFLIYLFYKVTVFLRFVLRRISRRDSTHWRHWPWPEVLWSLAVSWGCNVVDCGQRFVSFIISSVDLYTFIREREAGIFTRCLALGLIVLTSFSLFKLEELGNTQASFNIPDGILRPLVLLCNINLSRKEVAFI